MKKIYFLLFTIISVQSYSQILTFTDPVFKNVLLNANCLDNDNNGTPEANADINNDNEIDVSEALLIKNLYVLAQYNVTSLQGIENFPNLEVLYAEYIALTAVDVSQNPLLKKLYLSSNDINTLNLGTISGLQLLHCSGNNLTSLDLSNLSALKDLQCAGNQITSLDFSVATLMEILNCGTNPLTSLNISMLTALKTLNCSSNNLTQLNLTGLANLTAITCSSNNGLGSLYLLDKPNLVELHSQSSGLTSLDLSGNPLIKTVECGFNMIASVTLNNNLLLESLNVASISNNGPLTSLVLNNLPALQSLICNSNQLTEIDTSQLPNLISFQCSGNPITTLDFSNNTKMNWLNADNCHLESLFLKNGIPMSTTNYSLTFSGNPNIRYICADESEIAAVQTKLTSYAYTNAVVNSYCSFVPGGVFYTVQGSNKLDLDANGCDANDVIYPNLKYTITNGSVSGSIFSNQSGDYKIDVAAGTHTISPIIENPAYFTVSPASVVKTFPGATSPVLQNFCISSNGIHNDLEISIIPLIAARPGFDARYKIIYKNKGNQVQSGTVNIDFNDEIIDLVSISPLFSNQVGNNLSWDFTGLWPFEKREINLTFNLNSPMETPPVNLGNILVYKATVTSAADETPNDNIAVLNQTVVNSLDPNDKTCVEGATIPPSEVGKYVHYLIRFENTGSASAFNIVVKDIIDTTKFDITSLIPLHASHSFATKINETTKTVEFIFENINLPFDDANNDGYLNFKIKTKPSLVLGSTFSNSASIYFDYNFPIITNNYTTTVANQLGNPDFEFSDHITLFPNPVKDAFTVETKSDIVISSMNIYNALGQLVLLIPNAEGVNSVDVSTLKTGTYFIKINSDKGTANTKFIKQ